MKISQPTICLQVKIKESEWLGVPYDFGNLIISIGDMLQQASGGYYSSTH